jgi:hypothetical protein
MQNVIRSIVHFDITHRSSSSAAVTIGVLTFNSGDVEDDEDKSRDEQVTK